MTNERECLRRKIDMISFGMDEARLYLDTHPGCNEAMCYFEKLSDMRRAAMEEYLCKYGPLSAYQYHESDSWAWVQGPMPWEKGGNV